MKKYKNHIIIIALALVLVVVLAILFSPVEEEKTEISIEPSVPETPTEAYYQNLSTDYLNLQLKYNGVLQEKTNLENQIALNQLANQNAQSALEVQLNGKDAQYNLLMGRFSTLQQDFSRFKDTINSADNIKEEAYNLLTTRVTSLTDQINKMEEIYPPKRFPNKNVYQTWRDSVGKIGSTAKWASACIDLQLKALEEGYIVNLTFSDSSLTYPTILISDEIYRISPTDIDYLVYQGKI